MVVFPNCKINIGLQIVRKRADGYHDLDTVFHPIELYDVLEVIESRGDTLKEIDYSSSGFQLDDRENNLCARAYQLLKKDFPALPGVQMHLHKAIPIGAGLGGGSADAAFTLKLLNEKFNLQLNAERLRDYALQLGSDCPFFIINQTCHATGRGEKLEPVNINLSGYKIIVVNPGIHINTALAFAGVAPSPAAKATSKVIQQPLATWRNELFNDFEATIFPRYADIAEIKNKLYEQGAIYASMSGTGSTVYGIFEKATSVHNSFPAHYFYKDLSGQLH